MRLRERGLSPMQWAVYVSAVRAVAGCSDSCNVSVVATEAEDGRNWQVTVFHGGDLPGWYWLRRPYRPHGGIRRGLLRDLAAPGSAFAASHAWAKRGAAP